MYTYVEFIFADFPIIASLNASSLLIYCPIEKTDDFFVYVLNKKERLLALPLLRTVHESFPSYGSSIL